MSKRIWIVGGSSGIGIELVKLWLKNDKQLIVSSQTATQN
ncbi:MAG TPA: short-chain dehydrogenase, partial [Campylobacterales bacterium]|nr:short-chain dehydrogenase [Campylobacterales bacterium]